MVGYFQDGAQVNVNTVFENVAASVKQRQILRVVNLESYPDALNDAKLYLNNQRLQPGDYKIQGQKVILDDAVDVNEDDVIVLRYWFFNIGRQVCLQISESFVTQPTISRRSSGKSAPLVRLCRRLSIKN